MTGFYQLVTPLSESERNARLYRGELIVFRDFDSVAHFTDRLRCHCASYLGSNPTQAQYSMTPLEIEQAVEALRFVIRDDEDVHFAWRQVLSDIDTNLEEAFGDSIVIRVQPPVSETKGSRTQPLRAHRDTWGSNLAAQVNWWAPLYATTPERTLALFPRYFSRIVQNNSADWNFREMVSAYRSKGEAGYSLLPTALKTPTMDEALAISLLPGDLLCFSGAHLHASVPNTTKLTRLSFETRTVNRSDMTAGLGAPNVDGSAPFETPQLFRNLVTGKKLGELAKR